MSDFYQQFNKNKNRISELVILLDGDITLEQRESYQKESALLLEKNKELFEVITDRVHKQADKILNSILFDDISDVTDEVKELDKDFEELVNIANGIISNLDDLKRKFNVNGLDVNPSQIKNEIKDLREKIRNLKQSQIDKYNQRVTVLNKMILELRNSEITDTELLNEINGLESLDICSIKISKYNQRNYLDILDYKKLRILSDKVENLRGRISNYQSNSLEINLKHDLEFLITKMNGLGEKTNRNNISLGERNKIYKEFVSFNNLFLVPFKIKLNDFSGQISRVLYEQYLSYVLEFEEDIKRAKLFLIDNKGISYDTLSNEVGILSNEFFANINLIDSICFKQITNDIASILNGRLDKYLKWSKELRDKINTFNFEEQNQKTSLLNKLKEIDGKISQYKIRINNSVVSMLNLGNIGDVDREIEELMKLLDENDSLITDKDIRKNLASRISRVNEDIKMLELSSSSSPNLQGRINTASGRINEVGKKYRKRCPYIIKQVKSAEDVYKKNSKLVLMSSGLAIMALSFTSTVGRILIPAIVLGNMALADKQPIFDSFNNILGKVINAKKDNDGNWILSNGIKIDSSSAITALLKSLAMIGKVKVVDAFLNKIKLLTSKIKLKERYIRTRDNLNDNIEDLKLARLYHQFKKSGKKIDEFCKDIELSNEDINKLKAYIEYKSVPVERVVSHGR